MQISNYIDNARTTLAELQATETDHGRELAMVKTKLDEAELWLSQVSLEVAAKIQAREAARRARIEAKRNR